MDRPTVKRFDKGRVTEGGEDCAEPDSKRERVFWKKEFPWTVGEEVGVLDGGRVRSVERRGIREGVEGSCSERVAEGRESYGRSGEWVFMFANLGLFIGHGGEVALCGL